uniref:Uncharacterized protein n=1 Tax=Populus trichocarpa TaxID=3694 RepID=A0A3N7EJ84_POPTR
MNKLAKLLSASYRLSYNTNYMKKCLYLFGNIIISA